MASTYTSNNQFEKPAHGDQLNSWDVPLNNNLDVLDQAIDGVASITLNSTSYTLSAPGSSTQALSHCKVLVFSGSPGGTATVTITPNTLQKWFWVANKTSQGIVFTTGSGGTVTVAAGSGSMIYLDGSGSVSNVLGGSSNYIIGGALTTGSITNNGNLANAGTLSSTGAATFNGVTNNGNTVIAGTTALNGAVTLGAGLDLNSQTVTGNGILSGSLTLSGADTFTAAPKMQAGALIGSASAGSAQTLQLTNSPGAPIAGRLLFGTDNTGWQLRIGKNVAGTITDYIQISDNGNVLFENGAGVNVADGLTVSGGGLALGSQTVSGSPTFSGNLTVSGTTTSNALITSGAVTSNGAATFNGGLTIGAGGLALGTRTVTGNPIFNGNPSFTGTPSFSSLALVNPNLTGTTTVSGPITFNSTVTFGGGYQTYTASVAPSSGSLTAVSVTGQYLVIGAMCHVMINGNFTVPAPQGNISFVFVSLPPGLATGVGPATPAAMNITGYSNSVYCFVQPAPGSLSAGFGCFSFVFPSLITAANQTIAIAANVTYRIA